MGSIKEFANRAVQLFDDCLRCPENSSSPPSRQEYRSVLKDLRGRFLSWCGNLGARQHGHISLDWRLRDSTNMFQRVVSHLSGLTDDLEDCEHSQHHR